ncbi:uncharacterized protein LOC108732700 isoform X1 [Agrilus planipennis]|uniref:Uncharacterized protein LOC108732700 isoform X1 n=1 Tax=Agrilus planipennis TaxID=224129 RepID=A0A1W4WGL2_AGRPL|nr:uncharacterized protein LOC108732700 isoform X1 [Agrilus planipennis]
MPFVCPPKEDSSKRLEVLKQIKDLVNKLGEPAVPVKLQVPCVPCCVPCAPPPCPPPVKSSEKKCKPPDVMVCYRIHKGKAQGQGTEDEGKKLKPAKSRELRCGILYMGCDCEKRNGLQDDCRRTGCQGSPQCLTRPPTCAPSEFSNGKHLGKKNNYFSKSKKGGGKGGDAGNMNIDDYCCYPATIETQLCPFEPCPCEGGS